jgi:ribosomal protein L37E
MNEALASDLLKRGETHPAVLDKILTELWPDWINQEPETTLTMLRSFTKQGAVNPLVRTKVNALKLIHASEGPWEDWEEAQWVCQALNDNIPDFANLYRPELGELFIAVETMNELRKLPFSDEVVRWMAACCLDQGIVFSPYPLNFLNDVLARVEYRCVRCGNVDLDEHNNKCDTCGAPDSSLVRQPRYIDPKIIEDAWKEAQHENPLELRLGETVKGVHLAKLVAAVLATADRRKQRDREMDYAGLR